MLLEEIKAGSKVWDDEMAHLGEGIVLIIEDDMIEVHYPNVEEIVEYSFKEALKHLNLLL